MNLQAFLRRPTASEGSPASNGIFPHPSAGRFNLSQDTSSPARSPSPSSLVARMAAHQHLMSRFGPQGLRPAFPQQGGGHASPYPATSRPSSPLTPMPHPHYPHPRPPRPPHPQPPSPPRQPPLQPPTPPPPQPPTQPPTPTQVGMVIAGQPLQEHRWVRDMPPEKAFKLDGYEEYSPISHGMTKRRGLRRVKKLTDTARKEVETAVKLTEEYSMRDASIQMNEVQRFNNVSYAVEVGAKGNLGGKRVTKPPDVCEAGRATANGDMMPTWEVLEVRSAALAQNPRCPPPTHSPIPCSLPLPSTPPLNLRVCRPCRR